MFGKLFHLGVDAILISAFLAGVKRSTGLTYVPSFLWSFNLSLILSIGCSPALSQLPNKDIRREFFLHG
jgi:Fungal protein of unknown function (DUF1748)